MAWDILPNRGFILERIYPHEELARTNLSQFGGEPFFPAHYQWPRYAEDLHLPQYEGPVRLAGQPFHFIAQIDLDAITHDKSTINLPRKGMLYFFADLTMNDYMNQTASCCVLHYRGSRASLNITPAPTDTPCFINRNAPNNTAEGLALYYKDHFKELPYWPMKLTPINTLPREDPWKVKFGRDLSEDEQAFMTSLETAFPQPSEPTATDFPDDNFPYNIRLAQIFLRQLKKEIGVKDAHGHELKEVLESLITPPENKKALKTLQQKTTSHMIACDIDQLIEQLNGSPAFAPLNDVGLGFVRDICNDVREKISEGQKHLDAAKVFACTQGIYYLYRLSRGGLLKTCAPILEILSRFDRPYPAQSQTSSARGYHHQFFGHPSMPQDTRLHQREARPPQHLLQIQSDDALLWSSEATLYFWLEQADLEAHEFPRAQIEIFGT